MKRRLAALALLFAVALVPVMAGGPCPGAEDPKAPFCCCAASDDGCHLVRNGESAPWLLGEVQPGDAGCAVSRELPSAEFSERVASTFESQTPQPVYGSTRTVEEIAPERTDGRADIAVAAACASGTPVFISCARFLC